ncbi:hypothetical protein EDD22DRAFT_1005138 [Suillus occidentalis]|nr:hypothetical protein EDD22DRAFT_1005138 [Suillus occidentalis]
MSLSKPFTLLRMVKKICLVISRGLIEDCEFVTVTPPRSHTPARPSRRYMRRQTKSSSAYVSGGIAMDTTSFHVLDQNGQVQLVQPHQISMRQNSDHAIDMDSEGHELHGQDNIKEIEGEISSLWLSAAHSSVILRLPTLQGHP